jgi:hypothetical protein
LNMPIGVPAGRQRFLQVVSGSCREVPGGKNSRAKVIIKILCILFYLRCQWMVAVVLYIHVSVNEINNITQYHSSVIHSAKRLVSQTITQSPSHSVTQ